MKYLLLFSLLATFILSAFQLNLESQDGVVFNGSTKLSVALNFLGAKKPFHKIEYSEEQVKQGEELVKLGRTTKRNGKKTKYVSLHYNCTTCHNLETEDPDLRISDPEARLPFVKEKGIPFLQGSTFKGIVNRESWYNDDYVKKYGEELISKAHQNLKESIQLCATECAQGRKMKYWEIDAVLAYFWTLEFNLNDLKLSDADFEKLNGEKADKSNHPELINWLKTFYAQKSPATFYDAAPNKRKGYEGYIGNPENGKDIYELSCLHCHRVGGVSHYILDDKSLSFKDLKRTMFKNSHFSLYQIIPYGTYAIPGHKPYMPHYPLERMNKQQVEDLRSYIEKRAK